MEATDDLAMCGIVVDLGFKKMEKVAVDSAIVKYQDGIARCMRDLTYRTDRFRAFREAKGKMLCVFLLGVSSDEFVAGKV